MHTFEMNLSLESVSTLKNAIAAKYDVAFDNQVLLVAGGDYLEDGCQVCKYNGAGQLSNPIFLFNKSAIMQPEQHHQYYSSSSSPSSSSSSTTSSPINQQDQYFEACLKEIQIELDDTLKSDDDSSLSTINKRTEIAKKFNQLTTDLMSSCETLIRDQHLLFQGWGAVIANLEDVGNSFVENVKSFEESLKLFLTKRECYIDKLNGFESNLEMLNQIKILSCLHASTDNEQVQESTTTSELDDESKTTTTTTAATADTLLDLISQKGNKHSLDKVSIYCKTMLEQFDEQLLEHIKEEMNVTIKTIDDNKKIKKIENRLYNLDMLLIDVHKLVEDQNLLTYSFVQNQNSANQYNDPSVFADLSKSHKTQLDLMLKHFTKAISIRKKFQNSKRELTFSLLARLKTIMICETELNSLNWRVVLYAESLKKLKRSLEVVEQLNLAPKVYFTVFKEINRRNKFNFFFKIWSSFIVQMNSRLVQEENDQREAFGKLISNHFLKSFFPRFTDNNVPEFACRLPPVDQYDELLPMIKEDEFCEFINANSKFDETNSLEREDNLLNGLVYRFNNATTTSRRNGSNNDEVDIIENDNNEAMMMIDSEDEKLSLVYFLETFFNDKRNKSEQQQSSSAAQIDQIRHQLNEEYLIKLNELKQEYERKLNEKLNDLRSNNDQDAGNQEQQQQQQEQLDKQDSLFVNYRRSVFKNLVNELSTVKYTDYLKSINPNNNNQLTGEEQTRGPNFISFVSSLFSIIWPKNNLF